METNIEIPQEVIDFAKELGSLCKKHGLSSFQGTFYPRILGNWHQQVSFNWEAGRHNADAKEISITSQVTVRKEIE